jgi:hypothetical protein
VAAHRKLLQCRELAGELNRARRLHRVWAMTTGLSPRRNLLCAVAIFGGSYLVAAFSNASPVTQPSFTGASMRPPVVIVVAPSEAPASAEQGPVHAQSPYNFDESNLKAL